VNRLVVYPAALEDAEYLAPRLRPEDVAECQAASGQAPLEALNTALEVTRHPRALLANGQPIALFGVATVPGQPDLGAPWLLGSPEIEAHSREFLRRSREELERMRHPFTRLTNYVDARNHTHIRWLEWLGARFVHLDPTFGHEQRPFWLFEI